MIWLVVLTLIGWFIFNQMNKNKPDTQKPHLESAIDILKKRFAKGEIKKEQFERMKNDLT